MLLYVGTFGRYVGCFFALGRRLAPCWAFVAHVGRFFYVLGCSGSDFGPSKDNFEGSETSFFEVLSRASMQYEQIGHLQKPQFFFGLSIVLTHSKHCAPALERQQIVPGAC